jgi:hypothetical protein
MKWKRGYGCGVIEVLYRYLSEDSEEDYEKPKDSRCIGQGLNAAPA